MPVYEGHHQSRNCSALSSNQGPSRQASRIAYAAEMSSSVALRTKVSATLHRQPAGGPLAPGSRVEPCTDACALQGEDVHAGRDPRAAVDDDLVLGRDEL